MAEDDTQTDDEVDPPEDSKQERARGDDISKRAGVSKHLLEVFDDVEMGFTEQSDRSDALLDYWDIYNCKLNANQGYNGNSRIFVPIVHNAINARKTRFVNQIFPQSGRNVEVTSENGEQPYALMSLLENYVGKAKLRTEVMPALMKNGDIEGQYSVYISWEKTERNVTWRVKKPVEMEDGDREPRRRAHR